jgi:hypothetical protein
LSAQSWCRAGLFVVQLRQAWEVEAHTRRVNLAEETIDSICIFATASGWLSIKLVLLVFTRRLHVVGSRQAPRQQLPGILERPY